MPCIAHTGLPVPDQSISGLYRAVQSYAGPAGLYWPYTNLFRPIGLANGVYTGLTPIYFGLYTRLGLAHFWPLLTRGLKVNFAVKGIGLFSKGFAWDWTGPLLDNPTPTGPIYFGYPTPLTQSISEHLSKSPWIFQIQLSPPPLDPV